MLLRCVRHVGHGFVGDVLKLVCQRAPPMRGVNCSGAMRELCEAALCPCELLVFS